MRFDVTAARPVARQQLHDARHGQVVQYKAAQVFNTGIIEDSALIGIGDKLQAFDPIVRGEF